jgi:hypothetical protein
MTPEQRRQHVEDACAAIILAGQPVTFDEVAARTGLGRATLYRNPTCAESSKNTAPTVGKPTPCLDSPPRSPTSVSRWTPLPPPSAVTKKNSAASVRHNTETPQRLNAQTEPGLAG